MVVSCPKKHIIILIVTAVFLSLFTQALYAAEPQILSDKELDVITAGIIAEEESPSALNTFLSALEKGLNDAFFFSFYASDIREAYDSFVITQSNIAFISAAQDVNLIQSNTALIMR